MAFCFGSPNLPSSQATANACLFAGAPDLLAACEAILPLLRADLSCADSWVPEIAAIEDAIAKAKEVQP